MQLIAWVLSPNLKGEKILSQSVLENKSSPKNPFIQSNILYIYYITPSCLRIHKYATRTISPSFFNNIQLISAGGACRQFLKSRVPCSANRTATFNPADAALDRNGDVHPTPGPGEQFTTAKLDVPTELKGPINYVL